MPLTDTQEGTPATSAEVAISGLSGYGRRLAVAGLGFRSG